MSAQKAFLEQVQIKNFLSLRNVTLPLKPLTVLIGPNASGKSNILRSLNLLNIMVIYEQPLPTQITRYYLWDSKEGGITFLARIKVGEIPTEYQLALKGGANSTPTTEELRVNGRKIISIQDGQGIVQDEGSKNKTKFISSTGKLALGSAGDYGNKPITSTIRKFIKNWNFYDYRPHIMRQHFKEFPFAGGESKSEEVREHRVLPKLYDYGSELSELLTDWYFNDQERFDSIQKTLASFMDIRIDYRPIDGERHLCLLVGSKNRKPIHLWKASDGILRVIGYYALLNQQILPPLIAIEEPERNLHPGALKNIASVLEQLAERTQVIITTHSSQLLDAFSYESLSDSLGVLLLRNRPEIGTEVLNLEDIRGKRESLDGWIADFGIGSAVFDSGLLQDLMEEPI